ncbi:MAG: hypothetical protein QNK23_06145 [Crocinitomicaceae bacterium]|nr:hypothetical protein [Crocinitomicaceae bacterium]
MIRILIITLLLTAANSFGQSNTTERDTVPIQSAVQTYADLHMDTLSNSISTGVAGEGTMQNGKLFPFEGSNFKYFSEWSYLHGRAFMNHRLRDVVLESYDSLLARYPDQYWGIMECSLKSGGKISGHRTHQNGLSIDFMTPLKKNDSAYYGLNDIGGLHYQLDFNDEGKLRSDTSISIDFDMMGEHILSLNEFAKLHGLKIKKVILMKSLKNDLYATPSGKMILKKKIYITMNLPPNVDKSHDDHYHIDFEVIP